MKVIMICAPSLDGYLAHSSAEKVNWTSPEDKAWFKNRSLQAGAVIMGANTYKTYGNKEDPLPGRLVVVVTNEQKPDTDYVWFRGGDPHKIVAELEQTGYSEVAEIGGGHINAQFLQAGLLDELWVTVTPRIFGEGGIPLFAGDVTAELELIEQRPLGPGEVLHGYKVKK